jgi:predicted transcriptional regulator
MTNEKRPVKKYGRVPEDVRAYAVRLFHEGKHLDEISETLEISPASISRYVRAAAGYAPNSGYIARPGKPFSEPHHKANPDIDGLMDIIAELESRLTAVEGKLGLRRRRWWLLWIA